MRWWNRSWVVDTQGAFSRLWILITHNTGWNKSWINSNIVFRSKSLDIWPHWISSHAKAAGLSSFSDSKYWCIKLFGTGVDAVAVDQRFWIGAWWSKNYDTVYIVVIYNITVVDWHLSECMVMHALRWMAGLMAVPWEYFLSRRVLWKAKWQSGVWQTNQIPQICWIRLFS